jgi:hypothetical protein
MTYKDFERCLDVVKFWRSKFGREEYQWPDSRDPDLQPLLNECEVVPQDLEKALVALAAWRHAEDGVYQSISSIVHLIRNRQNQGRYRSHLDDADQFPRMADPEYAFWGKYRKPEQEPEFEKILSNLDDILNAKTVDLTQGSIYFGIVGDAMPQWFIDITHSPEMERTVKLNNTTFYRKKQ